MANSREPIAASATQPLSVDALADELLVAIRDADPPVLGPHTDTRLLAAYNRLYCELHDKAEA